MGRPTHRKSITAEIPISSSVNSHAPKIQSDIPPWVLAMILKSERGMQRALIPLSHVPWMGIHPSKISRHVAELMTAKIAMRM